jgi:hypothetical protein
VVLEAAPRLLGYYRLLLNVPQKTFYDAHNGFSALQSMESKGTLRPSQKAQLPALCAAMGTALADLVRRTADTITTRDIAELPLLTLGSQLQGGANNIIGQRAIDAVFQAITNVVSPYATSKAARHLAITNPAGLNFVIAVSGDPEQPANLAG